MQRRTRIVRRSGDLDAFDREELRAMGPDARVELVSALTEQALAFGGLVGDQPRLDRQATMLYRGWSAIRDRTL